MVRVILVAHAPLASALCHVAEHAFPDDADSLLAVDVQPEWDLEQTIAALQAVIGAQPTLVLVDVPGATPSNAVAQLLARTPNLAAIHGLNVPMLWRVLSYRHEGLEPLAQRALQGGVVAIGRLKPTPADPQ